MPIVYRIDRHQNMLNANHQAYFEITYGYGEETDWLMWNAIIYTDTIYFTPSTINALPGDKRASLEEVYKVVMALDDSMDICIPELKSYVEKLVMSL